VGFLEINAIGMRPVDGGQRDRSPNQTWNRLFVPESDVDPAGNALALEAGTPVTVL